MVGTVGSVGVVKGVPEPRSRVAQEALNLLSVLGGSKDTKALLNELKSVQEGNEEAFRKAKEALAEYRKLKADVEASQARLDSERAAFGKQSALERGQISQGMKALAERRQVFESEKATKESEIAAREKEISQTLADLKLRENALQSELQSLKASQEALAAESANVSRMRASLEQRQAELQRITRTPL